MTSAIASSTASGSTPPANSSTGMISGGWWQILHSPSTTSASFANAWRLSCARALAIAFQTLKYAGVAYLLYMAWMTLKESGALSVEKQPLRSNLQVIVHAILINILNPKLTIFFFAFLPQFVSGSADPLPRMLLLSLVFMLVTFVVFALYGWVAAGFRRRVLERPRVLQWLRRVFAGTYLALAGRLAVEGR